MIFADEPPVALGSVRAGLVDRLCDLPLEQRAAIIAVTQGHASHCLRSPLRQIAKVEGLAQLLERGGSDPCQLLERLESSRNLTATSDRPIIPVSLEHLDELGSLPCWLPSEQGRA